MDKVKSSINFQFITVAWGKPYVDLLVNIAIPSQMAPDNIPSFQYLETSTYIVYTTSRDRTALDRSPAFARLSQLLATEIRLIDDIDLSRNKYGIASECQKRALADANETETAFVWLYPDVVWPNGALSNMGRIAATGKRAVLHVGLSSVTETCVPELLRDHHQQESDTISVPTRQLVKLAIKHMDPALNTLFWDSDHFNSSPSQLFWDVPGEGLLTRWFHLVPLMVYPRRKYSGFTDSIDSGDFVRKAGLKPNEIYVAEDSDDIFQFSVSTPKGKLRRNTSSIAKVLNWSATSTGNIDATNLRHRFRICYAEPTDKWLKVERESDAVVEKISRLLKFRFVFLLFDWKNLTTRVFWSLRHSKISRAAKYILNKVASA